MKVGNTHATITDHSLQYLCLEIGNSFNNKTDKFIREFSKSNILKSQEYLIEANATLDLNCNVNDIYDGFAQTTNAAFIKAFPLKRKSKKIEKSKFWFNDKCREALKKLDCMKNSKERVRPR